MCVWPFPLEMLHSWNPPNPDTQISRYKFKLNITFNLNVYRDVPRNLSVDLVDFGDWAFWVECVIPPKWLLWIERAMCMYRESNVHYVLTSMNRESHVYNQNHYYEYREQCACIERVMCVLTSMYRESHVHTTKMTGMNRESNVHA